MVTLLKLPLASRPGVLNVNKFYRSTSSMKPEALCGKKFYVATSFIWQQVL